MPDPNAPERSASVDADDSGDEDVFHDAHFPAEEEAVSPMIVRHDWRLHADCNLHNSNS